MNKISAARKTVSREDEVAAKRKIDPLYGYYFHVFRSDRKVQYQGVIERRIDETHYLVTLFEWFGGGKSTSYVVSTEQMCVSKFDCREGSWQFYENAEAMNDWYEHSSGNVREAASRAR
jgi:hypothetical protein